MSSSETGEQQQPEQELYHFVDNQRKEHTIPLRIKEVGDIIRAGNGRLYFYRLLDAAYNQKSDYQKRKETPRQKIETTFEQVLEIQSLLHERNLLQMEIGATCLADIERWLGVDSAGIAAGDTLPFLGVDLDKLRAFYFYMTDIFDT